MKPSNLRKRIEDYLFLTNVPWSGIHTMIMNRMLITPAMKEEYEDCVDRLLSLFSQAMKEVIGKDKGGLPGELSGYRWTEINAYNQAKQEARQRLAKIVK